MLNPCWIISTGMTKGSDRQMGMEMNETNRMTVVNTLPVHDATQLTEGGDLALIKLEDQLYTLRITRAGKLLLTK